MRKNDRGGDYAGERGSGWSASSRDIESRLSRLGGKVKQFCRKLKMEEAAGRLVREHLQYSSAAAHQALADARRAKDEREAQRLLGAALQQMNALIFWLGQLEYMGVQGSDAAKACRAAGEQLAFEIKTAMAEGGIVRGERMENRRRDYHLRGLIDSGEYDQALLYVDTIARMGDENDNAELADRYRGYRGRIIQIMSAGGPGGGGGAGARA